MTLLHVQPMQERRHRSRQFQFTGCAGPGCRAAMKNNAVSFKLVLSTAERGLGGRGLGGSCCHRERLALQPGLET